MKLLATAALVLLASCVADQPWRHAIHGQFGSRQLPDKDWEPVEDQTVLGLEWTARPEDLVIGVEVGGSYGSSDGSVEVSDGTEAFTVDVDLDIVELYVGPRVTIDAGAARPYFAVGVSYLEADVKASATIQDLPVSAQIDDSIFAGYARVGSDFLIGAHFMVGVDIRYLFAAEFEEFGVELDADSLQVSGRIGWSF